MSENTVTIGEQVYLAFKRSGLKKSELSKQSGVTQPTINKILKDDKTVQMLMVERVGKTLGMTKIDWGF